MANLRGATDHRLVQKGHHPMLKGLPLTPEGHHHMQIDHVLPWLSGLADMTSQHTGQCQLLSTHQS